MRRFVGRPSWPKAGSSSARKRRVGTALVVAALAICPGACGGSSPTLPDPGPDAGIDPSQRVPEVPPADLAAFCDWMAGRLGGYGRQRSCGDVRLSSPSDQAACVKTLQMVSVVCAIGDLESCANAVVSGPCMAGVVPGGCANLVSCGAP